jgi:hypothetical protein
MVYIQDNKTHEAMVELLPPNKKKECPKCHRILRTKHFIFNEILELEICTQCNKKVGTNKFYTPLVEKKRTDTISKFNITNAEKNVLINCNHKSLSQINNSINYLQGLKKKKRFDKKQLEIEDKNKIDLNKKLIEGLKGK